MDKNRLEWQMEQALIAYWQGELQRIQEELEPQIPEDRKVAVQLSFWTKEAKRLLAILLTFLDAGAIGGVEGLAAEAGIDIDWTAAITDASRWARQHAAQLVTKVTDTTKERIRIIVANWMETEHTFPELWKQLVQDQAFSPYRAKLIAATETTKAYAEGKMIGAEQLEKEGWYAYQKVWQTANDDRVCPICAPLQYNGNNAANGVRGTFNTLAGELEGPPAHPGCRCWVNMIPRVPE